MRIIKVKASERGLIIGKTGAGKSEFTKWLLRPVQRVMPIFIVDVKHFWLGEFPEWASGRELGTVDKPRLVTKYNPRWHVQVIQPDTGEDENLATSLHTILRRGRVMVDLDETKGIATATHVPEMVDRVWRQGRALGVPAWAGSQSGKGIPIIFKSQAEKWVILQTSKPDLEAASEYIPLVGSDDLSTAEAAKQMRKALGDYRYFYYDANSMEEPELMQPVPFKEKRRG